MSDKGTMPRKAEMADGHPQHVLMRASQHQAVKENRELKASARPPKAEDNQTAQERLKANGNTAVSNAAIGTGRGRGHPRQ